jgi:hypothetical protein
MKTEQNLQNAETQALNIHDVMPRFDSPKNLTVVVWLVADCGLLSYQITQNYKRVVTLQISTNTAINYTTGYK